jgi:hypothetical protein
MNLVDFIENVDDLNFSGTESVFYYTTADRLKVDAKTKAELSQPASPGYTNIVGEQYAFKDATEYWRKIKVITMTGDLETKLTFKDGTTKGEHPLKFKLRGFGPMEKEFAELVAANANNLILLIPDVNGVVHQYGLKRLPLLAKSASGGTGGDFRGMSYELEAFGRMPRTVDPTIFATLKLTAA